MRLLFEHYLKILRKILILNKNAAFKTVTLSNKSFLIFKIYLDDSFIANTGVKYTEK